MEGPSRAARGREAAGAPPAGPPGGGRVGRGAGARGGRGGGAPPAVPRPGRGARGGLIPYVNDSQWRVVLRGAGIRAGANDWQSYWDYRTKSLPALPLPAPLPAPRPALRRSPRRGWGPPSASPPAGRAPPSRPPPRPAPRAPRPPPPRARPPRPRINSGGGGRRLRPGRGPGPGRRWQQRLGILQGRRETFAGGAGARALLPSLPTPGAPAPPPPGVPESGSGFEVHREARDRDYNSGRGRGGAAAPTCLEGSGARSCHPGPSRRRWGAPRAPAGCCGWRMRSVVLPAEAGAWVGAEGAGKAVGPFPPPLPASGWAIPRPAPPTQSPAQRIQWLLLGVSGGAWPEAGSGTPGWGTLRGGSKGSEEQWRCPICGQSLSSCRPARRPQGLRALMPTPNPQSLGTMDSMPLLGSAGPPGARERDDALAWAQGKGGPHS